MKTNMSRRNFLMTAGATAGFAIASGYSPFSYAQNEKVRVGCIGTGGQGTFHIRDGITGTPDIEIVAVCDVFLPHQREAVKLAQLANAGVVLDPEKRLTEEEKQRANAARRPNAYYDYREMLDKEELDAVIIATPLKEHFPITMYCLDAGKYVFCEKTLVNTVEEGRAMVTRCHELGRWVQVGHQRRYNPKYNMAMSLAYDDNMIGRITHITAQWHRNHYWRRVLPKDYELNQEEQKYISDLEQHLNWRIYADSSEGLFTELATHQTDISNWFLKKVPSRVHAFGGLDYWRDGRTTDDNILLAFEYEESRSDPGFMSVDQRSMYQNLRELNRTYSVRSVYSSILANAKRGASELIQGDMGTFELTEDKCFLFGEDVIVQKDEGLTAEEMAAATTSGSTRQVSTEELLNGKELLADVELLTPDVYQFQAFADCIKNGGVPRNNEMVGFTTAITAIAAIKSRREGGVVEIDPAWYTFDFEVPSFYDYDDWQA